MNDTELEQLKEQIDDIFASSGKIFNYGDYYQTEVLESIKENLEALIKQRETRATRFAISESNALLRSAGAIAFRHGKKTNWKEFQSQVDTELHKQHRIMYPEKYDTLKQESEE